MGLSLCTWTTVTQQSSGISCCLPRCLQAVWNSAACYLLLALNSVGVALVAEDW